MNNIKICGLQKTTLLDYPGHVAATVFLGGCNFRCPFCHNADLLGKDAETQYTYEELLQFLTKRRRLLEGVCISGGEPTLQAEALEMLIRDIRGLGLLVKLDTNGTRPSVLRHLIEENLLDYVAMDIKSGPDHYPQTSGSLCMNLASIQESVEILKSNSIPYEFRTTVVKGIHTKEDFEQIGPWISGCPHYYLQNYVASDRVLKPDGFDSFTKEDLLQFAEIVSPYVGEAALRGIDY